MNSIIPLQVFSTKSPDPLFTYKVIRGLGSSAAMSTAEKTLFLLLSTAFYEVCIDTPITELIKCFLIF